MDTYGFVCKMKPKKIEIFRGTNELTNKLCLIVALVSVKCIYAIYIHVNEHEKL